MPRGPEAMFLDLESRILTAIDTEPYRPWCVHRLYEEVTLPTSEEGRDDGLLRTQLAADALANTRRAQRASVNAVSIGVHCQDSLYWSVRCGNHELEEFGREYEAPTILHRLASHFQCHGL